MANALPQGQAHVRTRSQARQARALRAARLRTTCAGALWGARAGNGRRPGTADPRRAGADPSRSPGDGLWARPMVALP
eukprot:13075777-Alexandrium_andersonii.AAC.1